MSYPIEYRLNQDQKLCFIHIPKTAGTTLTSLLDSKFHDKEICPARVGTELVKIPRDDLAQYRLFRGHFFYDTGSLLSLELVYITLLRNPIERVISDYEFMRRCVPSRVEGMRNHRKALTMSLKEYVNDPENLSMANSQTRHLSLGAYKDSPEQWLEVAKQNLTEKFACVGIVEQFQDSMALLSYTFGWNPLAEYQNLMVAPPKRLKQEQIEPEVLEAIASRNALDIALYDYAKKQFESRYAQMVQNLLEQSDLPPTTIPDAVQMQGLLEKSYRQRYAELDLTPTSTLAFDFNQAMSGSGWHLREGVTSTFRWTGPGTVSTLDFKLSGDRDLTIEFCIINALAPDILQSLTLQVNDYSIPLGVIYSHSSTTIFQGLIPKQAIDSDQPFTRFTFRVNRTISPQDLNPYNADNRPIGVALSTIQTFISGEAARSKIAAFLFDSQSQPWQETIDFVKQHIQADQQILAPTIFQEQFPGHMPEFRSPFPGNIQNYNPELLRSKFQWAIIHKGMQQETGAILGKLRGCSPVYANGMFIVFQRHSQLPSLKLTHPHVKAFYLGYLKYVLNRRAQPLYRLGDRLRLNVQKVISPDDLEKLRTYKKRFKQK